MFSNVNAKLRGLDQMPVPSTNESNEPSTSSSSVESDTSPGVVRQITANYNTPHPESSSLSVTEIDLLKPRTADNIHCQLLPVLVSKQESEKQEKGDTSEVPTSLDPHLQFETEFHEINELANLSCERCNGYKEQLQALQKEHTAVNNRLSATVAELHSVKKLNEELEMRAKAEKTLFEEKTASFEERLTHMSQRMDGLLKNYQEYRRSNESEFARLAREREATQLEMLEVEEHYQTLLGKRRNVAAEMAAPIDLPTEKTDLELYTLQMREDLLSTNVAREHLMQRLDSQKTSHNDQLASERRIRLSIEAMLQKRLTEAQEQIEHLSRLNESANQSAAARAAAERAAEQAATECKQYKMKSERLNEVWKRSLAEINLLKAKVASLQTDLITSETVQKDFVGLSQHLQVELEKQREQTHDLRWQDAEDVSNCASCDLAFGTSDTKDNCRHCGRIFCQNCLTKQIPAEGSRSRPAAVCDMCHTLLVKDAAPYFSQRCFNTPSTSSVSPAVATPAPRLLDRIMRASPETHPSNRPSPLFGPPVRPSNRPNRT